MMLPGLAAWPYALVAAGMVGINLVMALQFFPRKGGAPTIARATLVGFYLAVSPIFWIAAIPAVLNPSIGTWDLLFWGMGIMMATPFVYFITLAVPQGAQPIRRDSWFWPLLLAGGILVNELLMGTVFSLATGQYSGPLDGSPGMYIAGFVQSATSFWFFLAMMANMVGFVLWIRLPWAERAPLLALAATSAVAPLVPTDPIPAAIGMAVVMTAAFVLLFEQLATRPAVTRTHLAIVLGVAAAFTGMATTQFVLYLNPSSTLAATPFAGFMLAVMFVELTILARRGLAEDPAPTPAVPWVRRPLALTSFLASAFVAEWFMAAAFLVAFDGPGLFAIPGASFSSASLAGFGAGLAGIVVIIGSVTGSAIFLGLMGIEMGALVIPRIRRTPNREQRVRLGLALGCFAAYTVVGPTFVPNWSAIPGLWPNVGAFGPVSGELAFAMLASYAVIGVLAFTFGRRAYCSTLCPSAVMYGGAFSQKLIPTIQASPLARRNVLGNVWRRTPAVLGMGSWAMLGVITGLSAWNASVAGDLTVAGVDVAVFYSLAIWNVLWYAFFIAIPYVGMSPCRTWGFCSTGTFLGIISRFGRYRKESLDIEVCRACPTRDCGKACEVGLADLPVILARTGVFRAEKCVGAHDCIEACPYGNLVARDIRDDLRAILGLPDRHAGAHVTRPPRPMTVVPTASPVREG